MIDAMLFKHKARESLQGNWQTALVVMFFAGIFGTIASVVQSVLLKDVQGVMNSIAYAVESLGATNAELLDLYERLVDTVTSVPDGAWLALLVLNALSALLSPALAVSCNHYFICRNVGEDIGAIQGLTARLRIWGKALWLYVLMGVKIFLWSLLLFVPGILAALRYAMAPFYLAEDPDISAGEAIHLSKLTMADKKLSYFWLRFSFIGWSFAIMAVEMLLGGLLGYVGTFVVSQFLSLALAVYVTASCAAFYRGASHPDGVDEMISSMRSHLREAGMSEEEMDAAGLRKMEDDETEAGETEDKGGEDE